LPLGYKWNAGLARGFKDPRGGSLSNGSSRSLLAANGRVYSLSTAVHENLGDSWKTYFGNDTYLTCRDAFNGRFYWRKKMGFMNFGRSYVIKTENQDPMALIDGYVYVPTDREAVLKLDAISGDTLKEIKTQFIPGVLVTDDGVVVIASWNHGEKHKEVGFLAKTSLWSWHKQEGVIEAFDTKTNERLWKHNILGKSVLIDKGRVFVASLGGDRAAAIKMAKENNEVEETYDDIDDHGDPGDQEPKKPKLSKEDKQKAKDEQKAKGKQKAEDESKNKILPEYAVLALNLRDGDILWQEKVEDAKGYRGTSLALEGVVSDQLLVITGERQIEYRDVKTGKAIIDKKERNKELFRYKAARCVPTFRVNGISLGLKFMAMRPAGSSKDGDDGYFFDGARAACAQGTVPAYGAAYVTQNHCACLPAMIQGMMALGPIGKDPTEAEMEAFAEPRVVAPYDEAKDGISSKSTWTTFRGNAARNSSSPSTVNPSPKQQWVKNATSEIKDGTLALDWKALLKSRMTPAVLTDSLAIVGDIEHHEIIAYNLADGSVAWRYLTGGRMDVSPTIYKGICFVGDRTGYIYALKVKTGELLYTLRVAPQEKRMVSHGKIESVWPVIGGVLVHNGKAYAAAGRSEGSDGGLVLRAFIPETGKHIWSQATVNKGVRESRQNDILLVEGGKLRITESYFDLETGAHVKSPTIDYLMLKHPKETQAIIDERDKYAATPYSKEKFVFRNGYGKGWGKLKTLARDHLAKPEAPTPIIIGMEGLIDGVWTHVGTRLFRGIGLQKSDGAVAAWGPNGTARIDMAFHRLGHNVKSPFNYRTASGKEGEMNLTYKYQTTSLIMCKNVVVGGGFIANKESRNTGKKGFIQILDTATGKVTFKQEYDAQLAFNGLAVDNGQIVATFNDGSVVLMK
jgi:outer membrane protein assembly factor BamB